MRIAVVDDDEEIIKTISEYIVRYEKENNMVLILTKFHSALDFISDYNAIYDIIFMDINMPHMNGMDAVRKLRKIDTQTCVVFLTNFAKYAINGYEVNAFDYVLKPIVYSKFALVLEKAIRYQGKFGQVSYIVKTDTGAVKLDLSDIYYIETDKHDMVFHTSKGEYRKRVTLTELEQELSGYGFLKSSASFLVNLKHIDKIDKNDIYIHDKIVPLSRLKKNKFMTQFTMYLGRSID